MTAPISPDSPQMDPRDLWPPPPRGTTSVDKVKVANLVAQLLEAVGEDPHRLGLQDTPVRVARWWAEFMDYDPGKVATTFATSHATDQMVVVSGIRVWSLCEHHLLPFVADIDVAYIVNGSLLGLSKLARIAHARAHGLQVQERLVDHIARDVAAYAGTDSVAVVARGMHLCMAMRGIRTPAIMTTSKLLGAFRTNHSARDEFLAIAARSDQGLALR